MADRTLGKFLLALGGIARTIAGRDGERGRNGSYEHRKDTSHVNSAISSMQHSGPAARPSGEPEGLGSTVRSHGPFRGSESGQTLRAVIRNLHTADLAERPVRLRRVTHQFRRIAVDLVKIRAVRRDPAVGWAAGDVSTESPGGAVSRNLRACRVARDFQAGSVDTVAADVAVAEVRGVDGPVVGRYGQPAQLRGQARARVDLHERANPDLAVLLDGTHGASVADGKSNDEGIRPTVQEGDVERR